LLVLNDQALCALEASGRCEECAVNHRSALPLSSVYHTAALQAQGHTDPCRVTFSSSLPLFRLAQAQSSWCLTSGLKGLRRVARGPSMC
jgi:hypothetical protein